MEVERRAPTGPRRGGRNAGKPRAGRADRDGDLNMGLSIKGRSGISKSSSTPTGPAKGRKRDAAGRAPKGSIVSAGAQRAILRKAAAGDVSMKEARNPSRTLVDLKVTGHDKSKAATTSNDGGISALIKWLEKKASVRLGSGRREVKIKKSRQDGNTLYISVISDDAVPLLKLNNFVWAQANIAITRIGAPESSTATLSSHAEQTKAMLKGVLERRYNPESKFLDLTFLAQDDELKAQQLFDTASLASKFFPAMMRVLQLAFDSPEELSAAIESVSLAGNDLTDLKVVSTMSETLPKLHNLDLSNNKFADLNALGLWRRRFKQLQHLIVSNNPLEQTQSNYVVELMKWYPTLRMINNVQVRTEEEIAQNAKIALPFSIKGPQFHDEGGIAENFVRNFFQGMDTDRQALAGLFYDQHSEFSFALNTSAPRDPAATERVERQEWDKYIRLSRNLKKISQTGARQNRLFRGTQAIADVLTGLPQSKHPDITAEARKWMVESHMQPGIPDLTGQSPNGVDGFYITVHTEFEEPSSAVGQPNKKRSVDHIFLVGPGGQTGVRIHSHQLTIRAYGGPQAFHIEDGGPPTPPAAPVADNMAPPQLPAGVTIPMAEQMVGELTKQTNMTLVYSKQCLEQTNWDFIAGLAAFMGVKDSLPPDAFNPIA